MGRLDQAAHFFLFVAFCFLFAAVPSIPYCLFPAYQELPCCMNSGETGFS